MRAHAVWSGAENPRPHGAASLSPLLIHARTQQRRATEQPDLRSGAKAIAEDVVVDERVAGPGLGRVASGVGSNREQIAGARRAIARNVPVRRDVDVRE